MNKKIIINIISYMTVLFFIALSTIPIWIWFISITNLIRIPLAVIGGLFTISFVFVAIEASNSITSYEIENNEYFYGCEDEKE